MQNLSPIPITHPSHVNVQQFEIAQMESAAIRKNLNVILDEH